MQSIFIKTLVSFSQGDDCNKKILSELINELVIAMSNGHSCLILEDYLLLYNSNNKVTFSLIDLIQILKQSNLCDFYSNSQNCYKKPLVLIQIKTESTMLYFNRYYQYEKDIAAKVNNLLSFSELDFEDIESEILALKVHLPPNLPNKNQISAVQESAKNRFSIITGGPGTGKTTTIFILILVLLRLYKISLKIAIAAPTGKAVSRANESVLNSLNLFGNNHVISDTERNIISNIKYRTIHKLLGYFNFNNSFKYCENNYLDYDILIIDESSMLSLTLYYNLLLAINDKTIKHVIFLGDKNQLSSVEEGHVFSDLINYYLYNRDNLIPNITVNFLEESNRSQKSIELLAKSILNDDIKQLLHIIDNSNNIFIKDCDLSKLVVDLFTKDGYLYNYIELIRQNKNFKELFLLFNQFSILCNKNIGKMGVDNINNVVDDQIKSLLGISDVWYHGRAIIILENNQSMGLVNGDIGICLNEIDGYKIIFNNGRKISTHLLPRFSLAYAITIHKSQGSEYDNVMVVLDDYSNKILSKELIYTAITRAKNYVSIYAEKNILLQAIQKRVTRSSGLGYFLRK